MKEIKLHLGCGKSILPGHKGVDISPQPGVSVVCDLAKDYWPFADSSVDACALHNILEDLHDTIHLMEELWRGTKPRGVVHIQVPYYNSAGAFQDPTHVKFFTERTFGYFTVDGTTELSHYNYYSQARFEIVRLDFHQRTWLKRWPRRAQIFLGHHLATIQALMATPLAQEHYEKCYATLGGKPVHQRLATHWARLIELLYAAERWLELVTDPEVDSPEVHTKPTETPTEGVGIVEAPCGTLTHHYWTDELGRVTKANLIVGMTNNYAPIQMSTQKAAASLIKDGVVNEGLLNMVEMAFRAYDPCFGCATHSLPGQMPLEITVRDADGNPLEVLKQFC